MLYVSGFRRATLSFEFFVINRATKKHPLRLQRVSVRELLNLSELFNQAEESLSARRIDFHSHHPAVVLGGGWGVAPCHWRSEFRGELKAETFARRPGDTHAVPGEFGNLK